jgi:electron transfer flavoprotein beta subunit
MDSPAAPQSAVIAVAMKWVGLRPVVNALTGAVSVDERFAGASAADRAALELALRIAHTRNTQVRVVCVGGAEADPMLRDAIAAGASEAIRIDPGLHADQPTSASVAAAIADQCRDASLVMCGDWSLDRGSGSVPPLIAHHLSIGAACGVVSLHIGDSELRVERRLDGGRREVLTVSGRAVLSVEGSVATLRRAPLAGVLAARSATIQIVQAQLPSDTPGVRDDRSAPHRPPAPHLATLDTDNPLARVAGVLGLGVERTPPLRLTLDPEDAAEVIIERLKLWGQLPPPGS